MLIQIQTTINVESSFNKTHTNFKILNQFLKGGIC
jgi:hypothetical protein